MKLKSDHCGMRDRTGITHDFTVGEGKTVLPATLAVMRSCPIFANINAILVYGNFLIANDDVLFFRDSISFPA
jgi:hypothetical protein